MTNKTFNLDLTKDVKTNPVVFGRIGDGGVQTVTVNISNQNVPVDLTGYTITFEGVTNSQKSKIFDSQGVKTTTDGLKKGTFGYVFPSAAFGVSGRYETAYFSFIKDSTRDTTGQIDIIVSENADIDAEEAQTIITEYDKLVAELQEKTDQYISDSDSKFTELNKKIADLQTKIDDYTSSVQTTANDAIQAVNDALAKLKAADFYTKEEVDTKLTDLSNKVIANKGNLASGTDLDNVIDIGTYRIGGLTGGTDIINVPSERSGTTIYAYLTVSGTTTSVVQELIVYDSKTVSQIYSRSRSGSTPTFSPWSKTVMADDSGEVTLKDLTVTGKLESSSDVLEWTPLTMQNVTSAVIKYKVKSGIVFFTGAGNWGAFTANQSKVVVSSIPENYRPDQGMQVVLTSQNANNNDKALEGNILEDGTIKIWSEPASTSGRYGSFDVSYPLV